MKINTLRGRLRPGRPFGPEAVTGAPFAPKAWLGRLGLTLGPSLLEAAAAAPICAGGRGWPPLRACGRGWAPPLRLRLKPPLWLGLRLRPGLFEAEAAARLV